jgi:hypothetical protein
MNERINELAEQALQLVADERTNGDESRLNTDSYHVKELIQAKFAELIVKECLGIVANADMSGSWITHPTDVLYVACDQVKKHFGVKE